MQSTRHVKATVGLLLAVALLGFSLSSIQAASVYVLRAGNADSDNAVQAALANGGHDVTMGVETPDWDGTQASLADFDTVLILNSYNYGRSMSSAGMFAIVEYVCGGGGVVTGEWFIYNTTRGTHGFLGNLMPATVPSYNGAASTTYTQDTADPVLNAGLPASFSFDLANISGSESTLAPRGGATTYYRSSNGGGTGNAPGVVGWTSLNGKILSFSTLMTAVELNAANYRTLLANAVRWASRSGS